MAVEDGWLSKCFGEFLIDWVSVRRIGGRSFHKCAGRGYASCWKAVEGIALCQFMKKFLALFLAGSALVGCAGVDVSRTEVASGATHPKAIYIRTSGKQAKVFDDQATSGTLALRFALAPAEFSAALKEELEKIAPAMVLARDDEPQTGWLVESSLQLIDAGSPVLRGIGGAMGPGLGRSRISIHVRITDLDERSLTGQSKSISRAGRGRVIYEFDLAGGSRGQGGVGSISSPGLGYAAPFDYKNAAERVMMALSVDPYRTGLRTSPVIR